MSPTPAEQATFEALWKKVLDDLEDNKPHGAFVEHAQRAGMLPEAAKRYRERKEELLAEDGVTEEDERVELLDKRLGGIAMLAVTQLQATKSEATPSPLGRILTFIVVVFFLAAVAGFVKALLL